MLVAMHHFCFDRSWLILVFVGCGGFVQCLLKILPLCLYIKEARTAAADLKATDRYQGASLSACFFSLPSFFIVFFHHAFCYRR